MMPERDHETHPYSPDEQRIVDYISARTNGVMGGGADPIGFILASYDYMRRERNFYRDELSAVKETEV